MLSIRGLEVSVGRTEILRGIDLDIDKGDCLAIIGESGAGKSTLGLSIMGLLSSGTVRGEVLLNGRDLLQLNEDELRRLRGGEMAMVFQNIEDALDPVQRAGDQIIEAISIHRKASSAEEMRRLLLAVGLGAEKAESYPCLLYTSRCV